MKFKNYLWLISMAVFVGLSLTFTACGGDDDDDPQSSSTTIKVSPSVELLGAVNSTTTITVNTSQDATWTISGAPEWLSLNKSGIGSSTVTITATQENFSDGPREAELTFTTDDGMSSATCTVTQKGVLAANCRVSIGDMTVMSDGFAGDLAFDANCKGYREAFFFASALPSLTERDVFNALMEESEYKGSLDFFASPYISPLYYPEKEIVYCIAAYGSETNPDGTHKYGPVTMIKVKTKAETPNSDMLMALSYTTSTWKVATYRQGSYGQRCDYYYYLAGEGSGAEFLYNTWMSTTDAYMAHFYFMPEIEKNADWNFKNGPQTLVFSRSADKFCCITWGKHNSTNEFSAELQGCWYPSDFSSVAKAKKLNTNKTGSIAFNRKYSYVKEMPKFDVCVEKK
ncbi:MAG: BACON domain-containing protein [Prevotella sp.]